MFDQLCAHLPDRREKFIHLKEVDDCIDGFDLACELTHLGGRVGKEFPRTLFNQIWRRFLLLLCLDESVPFSFE